jgi:FixJ family two-component response regulator
MPVARDIVFIVDGDQAVRDSLRFVVALEGMDVRACGSGAELLAHPELDAACCAIVDGKTLDRDGPEVLAKLEAGREILPVVLIADHVSRRPLARTIGAGLFHVVEKPVLDDALLRCVRAVRQSSAAPTSGKSVVWS